MAGKVFIYPYRNGSNSVALLKEALGAKTIRLENSKFTGSPNKTIINWGNSQMKEEFDGSHIVNHPDAVAIAANKLDFFNAVDGKVSIPEYTTETDVAKQWVEEGATVIGRTKLTGNSGEGIRILEDVSVLDKSAKYFKVYTKYIPKKDEYRVHVAHGKVVDLQRKAVPKGAQPTSWKVRSSNNGFIFVREGVEAPLMVLEEAVKAVKCVGLDFGAVDVIYNNYREKAYVLEVNTAPGLEGQTVETYKTTLTELILYLEGEMQQDDNPF